MSVVVMLLSREERECGPQEAAEIQWVVCLLLVFHRTVYWRGLKRMFQITRRSFLIGEQAP